MATVDLDINIELLTPGTLRLWDQTPAAAWGGANPLRSSVKKYIVSLAYPGREGYSWETDGNPAGAMATGLYQKTAGELMAALGAGLIQNNKLAFQSGGLNVRVQAVSEQTVARYLSNYTVRLPSVLPLGALVWVKKEGDWVDISSYGSIVNGAWQWQCLQSLDLYTDWKMLINGQTIASGTALTEVLTSSATSKVIQAVLGQFDRVIFLVGTERQKWADLVLVWLNEQVDGCLPHQYPKEWKLATLNVCKLSLIGQLLDRLEDINKSILAGGVPMDIPTAQVILKRVQAELTVWKHQI